MTSKPAHPYDFITLGATHLIRQHVVSFAPYLSGKSLQANTTGGSLHIADPDGDHFATLVDAFTAEPPADMTPEERDRMLAGDRQRPTGTNWISKVALADHRLLKLFHLGTNMRLADATHAWRALTEEERESQRLNLHEAIQTRLARNALLRTNIDTLTRENTSLEAELKSTRDRMRQAEDRLEHQPTVAMLTAQAGKDAAEIERLTRELQIQTEAGAGARAGYSNVMASLRDRAAEIDGLKKEVERLSRAFQASDAMTIEQRQTIQAQTDTIDRLKQQADEHRRTIDEKQGCIRSEILRVSNRDDTIARLLKAAADQGQRLKNQATTIEGHAKEIARQHETLSELGEKIAMRDRVIDLKDERILGLERTNAEQRRTIEMQRSSVRAEVARQREELSGLNKN